MLKDIRSKQIDLRLKRINADNLLLENELRCATEQEMSEERTLYISYINTEIHQNQHETEMILKVWLKLNRGKFTVTGFINSLFSTFKCFSKKEDKNASDETRLF